MRRILAFWAMLVLVLGARPAGAAPDDRGLLWEVRSARTTVYLLGTLHVGREDLYPLPAAVENAYAAAGTLALEVDPTQDRPLPPAARAAAFYTSPDTLDRHLSPALNQNLQEVIEQMGFAGHFPRDMKPAMAAMLLTVIEAGRAGLDPRLGIDAHLARRAREDGKKIVELESATAQLMLLDELGLDNQAALLAATVEGVRSGQLGRNIALLLDAWRRGESDRVMELSRHELEFLPDEVAATLRDRFFDERNRAMAVRIESLLGQDRVVVVAVGAGHMGGPEGLVALLRARGFAVRQI